MQRSVIYSAIRQIISNYWQSYQTQSLSGLEMGHSSPGQPPKLTEEQRIQLAAMLEQKQPADVGFEARYTISPGYVVMISESKYDELVKKYIDFDLLDKKQDDTAKFFG